MNVEQVDPDRLSISNLNERKGFDDPEADSGHIEIGQLTESVAEIGVVQPPIVRPVDAEFKDYEVVIGQRRTLAAQEVNNFDEFENIDEIPVVVVEWDDGNALAASIVENVDAFQEEVGTADRARAIQRLKELKGDGGDEWPNTAVAEHLGVADSTIGDWLEPIHSHWSDVERMSVEKSETVEESENIEVPNSRNSSGSIQDIINEQPANTLQEIRKGTETPEESASILSMVEDEDVSKDDVVEARRQSKETGESMEQTVKAVAEEKNKHNEVSRNRRVYIDFTLSGDEADAIKAAAKDSGATPKQYAQAAIRRELEQEGHL